jgi:hypothetical protein
MRVRQILGVVRHEDYKAYSPKLEDILRVAMIGALKGFGVYSESPVGEGPTQDRTPAFPYDVQQLVLRRHHRLRKAILR